MLKDPNREYFADLNPAGGHIRNAQALGLQTPGVGTNENGLPITDHQLGFVSPTGGTLIVRRAGEQTAGYAERAYSLIDTDRFSAGRLRGLGLGLISSYQQNHRGWMYNDRLDGRKRKTFYFPDRFLHDGFISYGFQASRRGRASVQLNVANLLDANRVV